MRKVVETQLSREWSAPERPFEKVGDLDIASTAGVIEERTPLHAACFGISAISKQETDGGWQVLAHGDTEGGVASGLADVGVRSVVEEQERRASVRGCSRRVEWPLGFVVSIRIGPIL